MSAPRVAAVVVHWRDPDATLACVASLAGEAAAVVVVDNGGVAPIAGRLAAAAPDARCVRAERNLGYAGGANLGIRAALADGADVVVLLNDDVVVQRGATAAASAALADDPRIAVVGARVLLRDDPRRLWLAWGRVTWGPDLVALAGDHALDGPRWRVARDVDWVGGCAMWFRGDALRRLGLLDETFFAYHEEVEWCVRARRGGWRVVYAPDVVVVHGGRGGGGDRRAVRVRRYFCARNAVLVARRHASWPRRLQLAAGLLVSLPAQLVWQALRGRPDEAWIKVRGVRDALLGRRPPLEALGLR